MQETKEQIRITKEKLVRIATNDFEIIITSSFEKDNINDLINRAERIAKKYNKLQTIRPEIR